MDHGTPGLENLREEEEWGWEREGGWGQGQKELSRLQWDSGSGRWGFQDPSSLMERGEVWVFRWGFPGRTMGLWSYICREVTEREGQGQGYRGKEVGCPATIS